MERLLTSGGRMAAFRMNRLLINSTCVCRSKGGSGCSWDTTVGGLAGIKSLTEAVGTGGGRNIQTAAPTTIAANRPKPTAAFQRRARPRKTARIICSFERGEIADEPGC